MKKSWGFRAMLEPVGDSVQCWNQKSGRKSRSHRKLREVKGDLDRTMLKVNHWDNTTLKDPEFGQQWYEFDVVHKWNVAN